MNRKTDCCTPSQTGPHTGTAGSTSARRVNPGAFNGHEAAVAVVMRSDPKGHLGTDRPLIALDEEAAHRPVKLKFFKIYTTAVTHAQFAEFVEATGYRTEAEMLGNSFVFSGLLPDATDTGNAVVAAPWWRMIDGTCWHRPVGPDSDISARPDHLVIEKHELAHAVTT